MQVAPACNLWACDTCSCCCACPIPMYLHCSKANLVNCSIFSTVHARITVPWSVQIPYSSCADALLMQCPPPGYYTMFCTTQYPTRFPDLPSQCPPRGGGWCMRTCAVASTQSSLTQTARCGWTCFWYCCASAPGLMIPGGLVIHLSCWLHTQLVHIILLFLTASCSGSCFCTDMFV